MARTLDQITAELDKTGGYAADRNILNTQLSSLPTQGKAEIAGLDAKLALANDNILQGARSRGLGFSGIPLEEQARYAATDYAPAVANVKAKQESSRLGILQSLNALSRDQRTQAEGIFNNDRTFEEQQRQFNEQLRLQQQAQAEARRQASIQAASAGSYLSGGGGGAPKAAAQKASPQYIGKDDLRGRWSYQSKNGDNEAAVLLKYVGNDNVSNATMTPGEYAVLKKYGVRGNYKPGNVQNAFGVTF